MFRASELYHVPIYIACVAAGAGGTWYFTRAHASGAGAAERGSGPASRAHGLLV